MSPTCIEPEAFSQQLSPLRARWASISSIFATCRRCHVQYCVRELLQQRSLQALRVFRTARWTAGDTYQGTVDDTLGAACAAAGAPAAMQRLSTSSSCRLQQGARMGKMDAAIGHGSCHEYNF